jgi:hypothetical protein
MSAVQFFNSWLFAWLFWLSISVGGMALTMMYHLTGGGWGRLIRPITLSAAKVLPVMFVLFLPVFFGMKILFPWARPEELASDAILRHVQVYLNTPWFAIRFVIYFAVWIGLVLGLTHIPDEGIRRRISAGGLVAYVVLMSLAGVDWIMSRQPHWSSSIFGFVLVISQVLTAHCFVIVILWRRAHLPAIAEFAKPQQYVNLGNMLLMWVILWAYLNFAQYLITWTGNEQDDIAWYVQRTYGGWRALAGIIIFIHFLLPFFLLLMRPLKERIDRLGAICAGLLVLRVLDLYWNIGPQAQEDARGGFVVSPLALLLLIVIGAIWYAAFSYYLKRAPQLAAPLETHGSSDGASEAQSV